MPLQSTHGAPSVSQSDPARPRPHPGPVLACSSLSPCGSFKEHKERFHDGLCLLCFFWTLYCLAPDIHIHKANSLNILKSLFRYLLNEPTLTVLLQISAAPTNPHPPCPAFRISLSCSFFFFSIELITFSHIYNLLFLLVYLFFYFLFF